MTKELFKAICRSKPGRSCLITLAVCCAAALIIPKVLPAGNVVMVAELILLLVITVNTNKFSSLVSIAMMDQQEQKQEQDQ